MKYTIKRLQLPNQTTHLEDARRKAGKGEVRETKDRKLKKYQIR